MKKNEALKIYRQQIEKIKAYNLVLGTTSFDRLTVAPAKGNDYRNRMLTIVRGELYELETDKEFVDAVLTLSGYDLGEVMNREIRLIRKSLDDIILFSKEEVMEFSLAQMQGNDAWYRAKMAKDYKIFEPYLLKLIELSKKRAKKRDASKDPYDILLSDYEEGMNKKRYDDFFAQIQKQLLPLIKEINTKQDLIDDSFLYACYPAEKQALFMKDIQKYIGFDPSWSYMGETEHPFTMGISRNDVRVTTNYDEHNVSSAIFSIIHECGHGFYEHQTDPRFDKYLALRWMSSGMHESQSRFLENYLGRREAFFTSLYPKLQSYFPENLSQVTLTDFIRAINVSRSSLIRTDADELTYPIHILIRYELEKAIFEETIDLNNLDKLWNQKYEEYLGVKAPSADQGILQDIHWSDASFGYFPTYALGSAIGAQLFAQMNKDLEVDELLSSRHFNRITAYLKDKVQKYGALYDYDKVLEMATGEKFKPKYYIDYLLKKYKKLYKVH